MFSKNTVKLDNGKVHWDLKDAKYLYYHGINREKLMRKSQMNIQGIKQQGLSNNLKQNIKVERTDTWTIEILQSSYHLFWAYKQIAVWVK